MLSGGNDTEMLLIFMRHINSAAFAPRERAVLCQAQEMDFVLKKQTVNSKEIKQMRPQNGSPKR